MTAETPETGSLYHVIPLHYLPHLVATGALLAKSVLAGSAVRPRPTARRRDAMLGLSDYVHFYTHPRSPLLADKIRKGYPHAVLVLDALAILDLPGTGAIPYNTKSWRHREELRPVSGTALERLLAAHREGRYASLEVLARYAVGLEHLRFVAFIDERERRLAARLLGDLGLPAPAPLRTAPSLFPAADRYRAAALPATAAYYRQCRRSGCVLPPPALPFD